MALPSDQARGYEEQLFWDSMVSSVRKERDVAFFPFRAPFRRHSLLNKYITPTHIQAHPALRLSALATSLGCSRVFILGLVHHFVHLGTNRKNFLLDSWSSLLRTTRQEYNMLVKVGNYITRKHFQNTYQYLHKQVNHLQDDELVVILINTCDKKSEAYRFDFLVAPLDKVTHLCNQRHESTRIARYVCAIKYWCTSYLCRAARTVVVTSRTICFLR